MADSGTKDFGSILSAELYRIPNYQRGYAWTEEEVNAFLDDLEYITKGPEGPDEHYLNSIIVSETDGVEDDLHVIDGQQRLITASLLANEILRETSEVYTGDNQESKSLRDSIIDCLYENVFKSSPDKVTRRVLPAEEHRGTYTKIVKGDIGSDRDIESIREEATSPSEQKLIEASRIIRERVKQNISSRKDIEDETDKLLYLYTIARSLDRAFTATLHEVEDPSEAGRIFEAINDRGRNLNRADKIKSYIVYRATMGDVNINVEKIHDVFTEVYEVINRYASDPSDTDELVDRLVSHHWNMFAGQNTIDSPGNLVGRHEKVSSETDQIKYAKYHIPKEANGGRVEKWIESYCKSLKDASIAYIHTTGLKDNKIYRTAEKEMSSNVNKSDIRHHLYAVDEFAPSTIHCLLMAANLRFSDVQAYEEITQALEKLALRMFAIGGARRDTKRGDFEALSRVLFWKGRDDLLEVYPEDSRIPGTVATASEKYGIEGGESDADQIVDFVERWAYDYSHENRDGEEVDVFRERLENDNLDGLGVAGWGGISTEEVKNYALYRYEAEIRSGGAELPKYLQAGIQDYTVEHVWPSDQSVPELPVDVDPDEYAHYVERLGNLALLSLSENSSAKNADYSTKWERAFREAAHGTKMVRDEFPDPTGKESNKASKQGFGTWSPKVIEWRSERMADVLAACWGVSR